jgi:hypothetical protein
MPVICRDYDLLFTHVPKTGGSFVSRILTRSLGGETIWPKHNSFRRAQIENPPSVRVFTLREPVSWYRSDWAYSRASVTEPGAWPMWEGGDVRHPTRPLDARCGDRNFAEFVRKALKEFPNGFLRSVYCDFLNGSTHVLRYEHLRQDLQTLLTIVGFQNPGIVGETPEVGVTDQRWKNRAELPSRLEGRLRAVENLDGLIIPYVNGA